MSEFFTPTPGVQAQHRADIGGVTSETNKPILLLDIKTVHPMSRSMLPRASTHQGHAASTRFDATNKIYTARFPDCKSTFVPFVIERGGLIHRESWSRLKNTFKLGFTTYVPDGKGGLRPVVDRLALNISHLTPAPPGAHADCGAEVQRLVRRRAQVPKMVAADLDANTLDSDGDEEADEGAQLLGDLAPA
jgi:hypothetical protein